MTLNKILLVINIFFLQAYLIRFQIGDYPTNLQEILIITNTLIFLLATPFSRIFLALKKYRIIPGLLGLTILSLLITRVHSCFITEPAPGLNCLDFIRHAKFLVFGIVLTFIFLETLKTEKERRAGLRVMGMGALVFGLFSVIYNLSGYNVTHDLRLLGPLDAAVYLAFYLAPFLIYFGIEGFEHKRRSDILYAVLLAVLLIATRSMGAIGGTMLVLLVYMLKRSKTATKVKITTFAIAVIAAVVIFYSKILPTLTTEYSSLDERGQIWLTSFELLKNPATMLGGGGLGQFQQQYFDNVALVLGHEPLDYYVLQPHNIFLLFIFQFGILGLIFLIFLIYKTLGKVVRFQKNIDLNTLAAFVLLYFLIHGLIDTPIFKNDLIILFLIFGELALKKPANQAS